MAGARESLCFGGPTRLFATGARAPDRSELEFNLCRRSTLDMVIFDGAVNRDFSTCGSFSETAAGAVLCGP